MLEGPHMLHNVEVRLAGGRGERKRGPEDPRTRESGRGRVWRVAGLWEAELLEVKVS